MKMLFVCLSNIFRSQIAEACLKKLGGNAESAGVNAEDSEIPDEIISVAKERGLKLGTPKMLSQELLDSADRIILMDRSICLPSAYSRKTIRWDIPSCSASNIKKLRDIRDIVMEKVSGLALK